MPERDEQDRRIKELLEEAAGIPSRQLEGWLAKLSDSAETVHLLREAMSAMETIDSSTQAADEVATELAQTIRADPPGAITPDPLQIGPYEIKRRLGEGGFGVVFLAHQEEPIRRDVAVKVVRGAMGSSNVLKRFEAERQTLALMSHPGVARVIDAGTTDGGDPYFVMEYVEGKPLDEVCDDRTLDITARIELFIEVCQAVQHAHFKGIIHRDLKPGNILASVDGTRVLPRVIDFGIAKALDPDSVDGASITVEGQFIGTPLYMAPEQTGFTGEDVDARADVFSLGAVLYELLVGVTPVDAPTVEKVRESSGLGGLQRLLCERPAVKPSVRFAQLLKDAPLRAEGVAKDRSTDVKGLGRALRGDLDWILLRALERERDRRYSTPIEFANDLRRHLDHEPVEAGPPSQMYRLSKFIRRNRAAVVAVFIIFIALVVASIYSNAARMNAERRLQETESTLGWFDDFTGRLDPSSGGGLDLLAVDYFSSGYDAIALDQSLSPRVKVRLYGMYAGVLISLGDYKTGEECARRGLELIDSGDAEDEVLIYGNELRVRLAEALRNQGKQSDVIEVEVTIDEDTPEHHNSRGYTLHNAGDYEGARWHYEQERALRSGGGDSFKLAECLGYLGRLELDAGRVAEGVALIEESAAMCARLSESNGTAVAASWLALGAADAAELRMAEALEHFIAAHDLYEELYGDQDVFMVQLCLLEIDGLIEDSAVLGSSLVVNVPEPEPNFDANFIRAIMLRNRARVMARAGEVSMAEDLFNRSLEIPGVAEDFHLHTLMAYARMLADEGAYEDALEVVEEVIADLPENERSAPCAAPARMLRVELLIEADRTEDARAELRRLKGLRADFPEDSAPRQTLVDLQERLGASEARR